jgi:hypothetical protein
MLINKVRQVGCACKVKANGGNEPNLMGCGRRAGQLMIKPIPDGRIANKTETPTVSTSNDHERWLRALEKNAVINCVELSRQVEQNKRSEDSLTA